MTAIELVKRLVTQLSAAMGERWYAAAGDGTAIGDETMRAPAVYEWGPPPPVEGDDERHPFVCVRAHAGQDTWDGGTVQVALIIGAYGEDVSGAEEVHAIREALRASLYASPSITASSSSARLVWPATWSVYEGGQYPEPHWQGQLSLTYEIPRPREITDWEA